KDVMTFVRQKFDESIATVSKLTPAQIGKTYTGGEGSMTGLEMLMFVLDHTTHHRASAEMYLRTKGITPAEYQF
ncbi:MAG TPA: DinB family protein, partial [Vicinamibacterales bacterium]|nr:DinB family protein [Vicinamibacterales bacterium]